jgi:PKD repeat protein
VTNTGNSVGTGVILSDTIPAGLTNVSGGTVTESWVWWQIDTLAAAGGTAVERFSATVPCSGVVTNDAYRVSSSDQGVTSDNGEMVAFIVVAPTLVADFDQSATMPLVATTVHFTDTSTTDGPAVAAWAWDFGDGQTAIGATASHVYATDGAFTVKLTVTDTCGYSDDLTSIVQINPPTLVAAFSQSTSLVEIGTTVYFTDTSTTDVPPIAAWAWDFGDGTPLVLTQHASHVFEAEDTFTVTLTITDTLGYSDDFASTVQVEPSMRYIFLPLVLKNY